MLNAIKGTVRPLHERILVVDLDHGEKTTKAGIVVLNDDGKTRGVHPRWAKVYAKGPENTDEYSVGHWVLVEHGRWTRGMKVEDSSGVEMTLRMVDNNSIIGWAEEKPDDIIMGQEFDNGDSINIRPEDFGAR